MATNRTGLLPNLSRLPLSPSSTFGAITLENDGDAEAYPVWEVRGPGKDFTAISPDGRVLKWNGTLGVSDVLTIDTETGTVLDGNGTNRYAELDTAPSMWPVPPGTSTCTATLDESSSGEWQADGDVSEKNVIPNPKPASLTNVATGGTTSLVNGRLRGTLTSPNVLGVQVYGGATMNVRYFAAKPGDPVAARVRVMNPNAFPVTAVLTGQAITVSGSTATPNPLVRAYESSVETLAPGAERVIEARGIFPNDGSTHVGFEVRASSAEGGVLPAGAMFDTSQFALYIGATAPVTGPIPYIHGDLTDGRNGIYDWTGVIDNSPSTRTPSIRRGQSRITVSWRPRKWLAI
jgi:hypothetical protein